MRLVPVGGFRVRTDLALEARENLQKAKVEEVPGVETEEEKSLHTTVSRIRILSAEAERITGKLRGTYITIESPGLRKRSRAVQDEVSDFLAREITRLMNIPPEAAVLVVGLGNWNATPDALGPLVVNHIVVTRHLKSMVPEELKHRLRPVCAIAPGVLGLTGIETGEIVKGVIDRVAPDLVIAIDALAARNIERISTTIQIADTGIHPGSGVGTKRTGITRETLGVPVIAVGVPTVVHASTIANDTIDLLVRHAGVDGRLCEAFRDLDALDKRKLIQEVLSPTVGDLMVTPKEIDMLMGEVSHVVATGINAALHPGIDLEEMARYIH